MLFQVTRTSMWEDEKPFENCIPIKLTIVEVRTLHSPEEFDAIFASREGKWLENGTNHRIDSNGYINRDIGVREAWGIEINSLEELMNFKNTVRNESVIHNSFIDRETPCIEIYDDYRE